MKGKTKPAFSKEESEHTGLDPHMRACLTSAWRVVEALLGSVTL